MERLTIMIGETETFEGLLKIYNKVYNKDYEIEDVLYDQMNFVTISTKQIDVPDIFHLGVQYGLSICKELLLESKK